METRASQKTRDGPSGDRRSEDSVLCTWDALCGSSGRKLPGAGLCPAVLPRDRREAPPHPSVQRSTAPPGEADRRFLHVSAALCRDTDSHAGPGLSWEVSGHTHRGGLAAR